MDGIGELFTDHDNHVEELGTMEVNGSHHLLTPAGIIIQIYEPFSFHRTGGFHSTVFATAIAAKQHLPIKSAHIIVGVNIIHDEPWCSGVSVDQADADPGVMGSAFTVSLRQSHDCHGAQVKW